MRFGRLLRSALDPLVDLTRERAVVGDRCLDEPDRDLQVLGRLREISVIVLDRCDDLPDVAPGSDQPSAAAGRAISGS